MPIQMGVRGSSGLLESKTNMWHRLLTPDGHQHSRCGSHDGGRSCNLDLDRGGRSCRKNQPTRGLHIYFGAAGETRTLMISLSRDFESRMSTIPSPRHYLRLKELVRR